MSDGEFGPYSRAPFRLLEGSAEIEDPSGLFEALRTFEPFRSASYAARAISVGDASPHAEGLMVTMRWRHGIWVTLAREIHLSPFRHTIGISTPRLAKPHA